MRPTPPPSGPQRRRCPRWLGSYKAIPVNQKAYPHTAAQLIDPKTKLPWTKSQGFRNDIVWWADNRAKVSDYWNKWVLE